MLIFVFGDSIVYGSWDEEGGWVERLNREIHRKIIASSKEDTECYFQVFNLGISGDTTLGVLERFEQEIIPRLNEDEENLIIFAVGINDSQFRHEENDHKVPFEEYQENLHKLLGQAKRYSKQICFVGLTRVDERRVDPLSWDKTESYRNSFVQKYDRELEDFCKINDLVYVSVPKMGEDLLEDGLHPNSEGHKLILKLLRKQFLVYLNSEFFICYRDYCQKN